MSPQAVAQEAGTRQIDIRLARISEMTGYTLSHLSYVFRGKRSPSLECARKISLALGVTLDELDQILKQQILSN